jgi:hypothetical protein
MRAEFSINVNVNLGITPELSKVLERLFPVCNQRQPAQIVEEEAVQEADKEEKPEPVETKADAPAQQEQKAPEASEQDSQASQPKQYTELDVREAMHKARQRIEGEDYQNNTTGDLYKKYHRALSSWFKRTAEVIGGIEKPSALPADKRETFINECAQVQLLEDGTIGIKAPF